MKANGSPKRRAIVIDHDRAFRAAIAAFLSKRGYEVHEASDPSECPLHNTCECDAGKTCTNVIITDIKNEHSNGLEFLESLKIHKCKVGNMAVITVETSDEERKRISDLGCQFFQKPVKLKQLKDWLDKCESMPEFNSGLVRWPAM